MFIILLGVEEKWGSKMFCLRMPRLKKKPGFVVRKVDNATHWINLYPVGSAVSFVNTYSLDSDLSVG